MEGALGRVVRMVQERVVEPVIVSPKRRAHFIRVALFRRVHHGGDIRHASFRVDFGVVPEGGEEWAAGVRLVEDVTVVVHAGVGVIVVP
eukprot:6157386-Prymnesium_polylepis.2